MEQIIKLTGRIAKVFPANSGVSQRTGNPWMSQEYLLEFFSWGGARYPDRVVFRIFGEERIKQFNIQEMEENVTVFLRLDAHESDGRWYNEVSATNVIREGAVAQQQPTVNQGQQGAAAQPQPTVNQQQGGGDADDLPF